MSASGPSENDIGRIVRFKQNGTYDLAVLEAGTRPETKLRVAAGQLGAVEDVPRGKSIVVKLHDSARLVRVQHGQLDISNARVGNWKVIYQTPTVGGTTTTIPSFAPLNDILADHIFTYLGGLHEERAHLPAYDAYTGQLGTPAARRETARQMGNDFVPGVRTVLSSDGFTEKDLRKAAPEFANSQQGVYDSTPYRGLYGMFFFGPFTEGSGYDKDGVYIYIGKSVEMVTRVRQHISAAKNPKDPSHWSERSQCHRAAGKWVAVRLLVQDQDEGGTTKFANLLLSIYENTAFVLTRSYHPKTFQQSVMRHHNDKRSMEQRIGATWEHAEMSMLHNRVATAAAQASGYSDPQKPDRAHSFGITGGLNVSSPIGSESIDARERTIWGLSYMKHGKRSVYHRPGKPATVLTGQRQNPAMVHHQFTYTVRGVKHTTGVNSPALVGWPEAGDMVYTSLEVMDEGEVHPAPWISVPDVSCLSNHAEILRLGCKLIWRSQKSGKWFMRYVRYNMDEPYTTADKNTPGATDAYATGTGVLAFLARGRWTGPTPQPWARNYGYASVVEVVLDAFKQEAVCRPVARTLFTLKGPVYKREAPAVLLRAIGLPNNLDGTPRPEHIQNIDGSSSDLDVTWIDSARMQNFLRTEYTNPTVAASIKRSLKARTRCDECLIARNSKDVKSSLRGASCETQINHIEAGRSIKWCVRCFIKGHPCSYTRQDWLLGLSSFGNDPNLLRKKGDNEIIPGQRTCDGPLYSQFMAAAIEHPTNNEAYTCKEIRTPDFHKVSSGASGDPDAAEDAEAAA
ncbi:hypothetical protein LTR56_014243 [Elasticomyces elasticus]|nr:hypothetical protein LTR22_026464 [Elasticomyces elasticus]KAK3636287.1 hypothetical protein LTR56_014243 [Elasticomyces elasticus]KAK4930551.1 hypothetical protein LTR49_002963 [Elasticomyces elasticus]KAK5748264.1 hypothetical protein LTS12_021665 [Elasticomyces elasticus]